MKDSDFVRVCPLGDVPAGEARAYTIEGYDIAVFNMGDEVLAIESRCPHMGANLADGEIVDRGVCCSDHGWTVNLDNGEVVGREHICVATFPAKVEDEMIWVQLG